MELQTFFKDYMREYKGLDVYKEETLEGEYFNQWNYEDGCLLLGCRRMYEVTKDTSYRDYVLRFMDPYVAEDGTIKSYDLHEYNLDFVNAGKLFYFMYDETGEERWKLAADKLMEQLKYQPRLEIGNFWHKLIYPFQVWLDGLYMGQPFYLEYENRFNGRKNYYDIVNQFKTVRQYLYDEKAGLYYHAYDEYKERDWADKETGLSPNFWLRSIGWYLMALVDCFELASEELYDCKRVFADLYREAIAGVLMYQDPDSHLFYQLIALPEAEGNYLESSGSLMIAYSILKACRLEILLADKYQKTGEEILEAVAHRHLNDHDGRLHLGNTCAVAGLGPRHERNGSVEYYLSEPVVEDDPKAQGVMMMAYGEYLLLHPDGEL